MYPFVNNNSTCRRREQCIFFLFSRQITNDQNPETSTTLDTRHRTKIKKTLKKPGGEIKNGHRTKIKKNKQKKNQIKTTKQTNKVDLIKSGIISCLINKTLEKTEGTMMNGQYRDTDSIWHKIRRQTEQETQHRKQIHSSIVYFMAVFSVLWTSVIS